MCDADEKGFLPYSLSGWIDIVAKVGAIAVVGFGVYQYLDSKQVQRIDRTQKLMEEYSSDGLQADRRKIERTLRAHLPAIERLRALPLSDRAAAAANSDIVLFLVRESNAGSGLSAEIDSVFAFFDRVVTCVENELCEKEVAKAYFLNEDKWLFHDFQPYVEERRKNNPGFANAAERMLKF